jgi:hypothetical protein
VFARGPSTLRKRSHVFFFDVRHNELSSRILLEQCFVNRVAGASPGVRANFFDSGFPIAILRHFIEEQLKRCQGDVAAAGSSDWAEVFRKVSEITGLDLTAQ